MNIKRTISFPFLLLLALGCVILALQVTIAESLNQNAFTSPLPRPRATVYGWGDIPPAPTGHPAMTTPSQIVSVSYAFRSPLPTPTPIPDFLPPYTRLQITGTQGTASWYRSPVTVSFIITDNFGAGYTDYQLDEQLATSREYYYPPLVVSGEGVHTLRYRSIDFVRNIEVTQTVALKIDESSPLLTTYLNQSPLANGWYTAPVTVTAVASDGLSGVAALFYELDGAGWQPYTASLSLRTTETAHTLRWRVVDLAGNETSSELYQIGVYPQLCRYGHGYWKNHAEAWPVTALTLGGVTYNQAQLIDILRAPPRGDATYILAYQLISALLNIENGVDGSTLTAALSNAQTWLTAHPLGSDPKNPMRKEGLAYGDTLEQFNRQQAVSASCSDDAEAESTSTPMPTTTPTATATPSNLANPAMTATSTPASTSSATATPTTTPVLAQNCTYTQGYWKNHAAAWPVTALTLGGVVYSQAQLIDILRTPPRGDATYILAHQLIAARLNNLKGATTTTMSNTLTAADSWLITHPVGTQPGKPDRNVGIGYASRLNQYNNGLLGPGHCGNGQTKAKIKGKVWHDDNHNGQQEGQERGIAGVIISLSVRGAANRSASADSLLDFAISDEEGNYTFVDLSAGSYQVNAEVESADLPSVAITSTVESSPSVSMAVEAQVSEQVNLLRIFLPLVAR